MKEINDNVLKISGEVSLPEPLEPGHDYLISIQGKVTEGGGLKDNDNGTFDKIFKFKAATAEVLKDEGKTIKSIDRKRDSQKYRAMINFRRKEEYPEIEEEDLYHSFMGKSMAHFDEVWEFVKKLK